jgi:hypothetical protein
MMPMTKKYILLLLAGGMFVSASVTVLGKNNPQAGNEMLRVDLHAVKMNDGWGYDVLVDRKVFIHQDCIPAIHSFKKFSSEGDALAIGSRVVDKLKKGRKPSISLQEINESHILY